MKVIHHFMLRIKCPLIDLSSKVEYMNSVFVFNKQEAAVISKSVAYSPGNCILDCTMYDCIDVLRGISFHLRN